MVANMAGEYDGQCEKDIKRHNYSSAIELKA